MMKRKILILTLTFALLFSVVAGIELLNVAEANPYTAPEVNFLAPRNNTAYNTNSLTFNFLVVSISFMDFDYFYSLDDLVRKEPIHVKLVSQRQDTKTYDIYETYNFSVDLYNLTDGQHVLTLYYEAPYYSWFYGEEVVREGSEPPIIFYVDTLAPAITNLCVNETDLGDRLLSFNIDEETSWVGYSLDYQANVTIIDKVFLKGLSAGSHNVAVYAEDAAGNIGASATIHFTITEPPEPLPTALVMASVIPVTVVLVGLCLLFYGIKRKR